MSHHHMRTQSETPQFMVRVVLIGDSGVGKSNLLTRFTTDGFSFDNKSTLGMEMGTTNVMLESGSLCQVQIWDTAGQERFKSLAISYFRGAKGALLVYDITNKNSLDNAREWLQEFRKYGDDDAMVMLVGNKSDLPHLRAITVDEAKQFAQTEGLLFTEASALDSTNVRAAFETLLNQIARYLVESSMDDEDESESSSASAGTPQGPTFLRRPSSFTLGKANEKSAIDLKKIKKQKNCC